MTDLNQEYYLSWHDQISGPFSIDDINQQLRRRQISTLYKVQINGEWVSLRSFLADQKREKIRLEKERLEQDRIAREIPQQASSHHIAQPPPKTVALSNASDISDELYARPKNNSGENQVIEGKGLGIASFVLALLFFVPFLNVFCFILSLIFGHLSLAQAPKSLRKDECALPWFGVCFSYIMGGFLLSIAILILPSIPDYLGPLKETAFYEIHGQMIGVAVLACFFACLLMWAIQMIARYVPKFYICYICSLLPLCLGQIASLLIPRLSDDQGTYVFLLVMSAISITLINVLTWPLLICEKNDQPLSRLHAAIASIFCIVFFGLVIFLIFAFISLIN